MQQVIIIIIIIIIITTTITIIIQCTRGLVGLVRDWRVSSELSGSDHRQIRFTLDQIQTEKKWSRNPRLTNWSATG